MAINAGLAEWTMRRRNYLGVLQAGDRTLRLTTMRYSDEVVAADTLELSSAPLNEREISTGMMLIKQMSGPFEPGRYRNEYEKKLRALIEAKARGEKIKTARHKRMKPTPSDELLKALRESLKKSLKGRKA